MRSLRSGALALALCCMAAGAATSSATTYYDFDSTTSARWSDWAGLSLSLSGGKLALGTVDPTISYAWNDWKVTPGHPDPGSEMFDIEGIFYRHAAGTHNFLVISSGSADIWNESGQQHWRGDLAINPNRDASGDLTWDSTGSNDNRAALSVKTGGTHAGYAEYDALWGYGAATTNSGKAWRDPKRWKGNNTDGYTPGGGENPGDLKNGYNWGSNFYHGSGDSSASYGVSYWGTELRGLGDNGGKTYAYQISITDAVMAHIGGFDSVVVSETCNNDFLQVRSARAPEPASLCLIGVAAGAGAVVRKRRRAR